MNLTLTLTKQFDIGEILSPDLIQLNLQAHTKYEAIAALTDMLQAVGNVTDKQAFMADVFAREKEGLTGIGFGIAIPHGKSDAVCKTSIAIGRVPHAGIPWETQDNKPVRMVILFAVRNVDKTTVHLRMLSQVAMALAEEATLERLLASPDKQEIMHLLSQEMQEMVDV